MSRSAPTPTLSILVATWNCAAQLAEFLASLAEQTYADWELLLLDNASSDGTAEMARARGAIVLEPGDLGAAGRNVGAEKATNDLILFIDDDSHPEPGAVEELEKAFKANPRLAVAGGFIRNVDDDGTVLYPLGRKKNAPRDDGTVRLTARTRGDHIVSFDGPASLVGELVDVTITRATSLSLGGAL